MKIIYVSSEEDQLNKLGELLKAYSKSAIENSNVFRIGLSGGSSAKTLVQTLNLIQNDVELEKWRFFLCDERYVAEDSHDSNYGYYKNHLLQSESSYYLSILKEDQFLSINSLLPLEECALDYEKRLCKAFNMNLNFEDQKNIPSFDLLILGMGLDGHTCSLFPGHRLIELNDRLIAAIDDAPKPPPKRITMTLPIINEAQNCIFLISGEEKLHLFEDMMKNIGTKKSLPAFMIRPRKILASILFNDTNI